MFVELLNPKNYISFNIKTTQVLGLHTSIYLSELISIYEKAKNKSKLIDDKYFKLDRKYIFMRTTLTIEEQLRIDGKMVKIGIISKHQDNPDILKLDLRLYASIITSEDIDVLDDITKKFGDETVKRKARESKRQAIIRALKDGIQISNYELLTALRDWVDAIFANPKGNYLSTASIKLFIDTLNNYTKGDLDLALRLVEIATIQGYRDCTWAIALYEKDKKIQKSIESKSPRVTVQKKATVDSLGEDVY